MKVTLEWLQGVQQYLRVFHEIHVEVNVEMITDMSTTLYTVSVYIQDVSQDFGIILSTKVTGFRSYESALERGLILGMKLIK